MYNNCTYSWLVTFQLTWTSLLLHGQTLWWTFEDYHLNGWWQIPEIKEKLTIIHVHHLLEEFVPRSQKWEETLHLKLTSERGWQLTIMYVAGSLSIMHVSDRHNVRTTGSCKKKVTSYITFNIIVKKLNWFG